MGSFWKKLLHNLTKSSKGKKAEYSYMPFELIKNVKGNFDAFLKALENQSLVVIIVGRRGSGKTSLSMRMAENLFTKEKDLSFIGFPKSRLLPYWINTIGDIEKVKNKSFVFVDEAGIEFGSRDPMARKNKEIGKLLQISRHKDLSLFFVSQNSSNIDRAVIRHADVILLKEGSILQHKMERPEFKSLYKDANLHFDEINDDKKSYVYVISDYFEGLVKFKECNWFDTRVSKSYG